MKICKTDARPFRLSLPKKCLRSRYLTHLVIAAIVGVLSSCLQCDCVDRALGLKVKQAGRFVGCGLLSLLLHSWLAFCMENVSGEELQVMEVRTC